MQVAVIIPAYNEAKTIMPVIKAAQKVDRIMEIVVVSDGSQDETAKIAAEAGARVVELDANTGKAGALLAGARSTHAEIVVLLDADLIGLRPQHIETLIAPVMEEGFDMSVGIFVNGRKMTDLAQWITPFLSGQRAIKRNILLEMEKYEAVKYGIDIMLSRHAKRRGYKIKNVAIPNVSQVMKEEKLGFWRGLKARVVMYWQIIKILPK